ncbi:Rho guanyl-nucleotide exchange factor 12 [Tanacetum coccineum]
MINMDTMKIKATKVEITRRKEDDLPGYKNDHKHYKKSYKKSDGGFNQKMDQEDLKTYTAARRLQGISKWKLWFPNKHFVLNTVSITLIAIAMKLPVDLSAYSEGKVYSIAFLITMLANFLPSLGLMDDKELLVNMVAWAILLITITVNVSIQIFTSFLLEIHFWLLLFSILWMFSIAFTVPASRRILEHRYKELHGLASYPQEMKFSYEELEHNVKKYWMMAETGNPQFAIACSEVASAFGFICSLVSLISLTGILFSHNYPTQDPDYNWSINVIIGIQLIGVIIGSIAPAFRCFAAINCFELSKKWSVNQLNIIKIEEHWTQMLQFWKGSHVRSHIPGRHCKIVFHISKNLILNICIALQIMVVVICKLICLVPRSFLILISYCWYFFKLLIRFKTEENVSNSNVRSEMKGYAKYVLQIEDDAKLSERISRNALKSINQLLSKSEKNEPGNLIKLLKKSTGFIGVLEFDKDQVPPLHSEETKNSWSLVVVTLTAIVVALPNTANDHGEGLIASMREGLQIVRIIEECLNANSDLVKTRKAARRVWTQVEVYRKWLQIDLQKKAHDRKTSKEILEWLRDEAVKIVIQFKSCKKQRMDDSHYKFIVANKDENEVEVEADQEENDVEAEANQVENDVEVKTNMDENDPETESYKEEIEKFETDVRAAAPSPSHPHLRYNPTAVKLVMDGDGTTDVVLLAGEFSREAKPFIEDGVRPQNLI